MENFDFVYTTDSYEMVEPINFDGIIVIDGICGSGKTSSIQEFISEVSKADKTARFIYVTPYLKECHRVAGTLPEDETSKDSPPLKDSLGEIMYLKKDSKDEYIEDTEKKTLAFKHPEKGKYGKLPHTLSLIKSGANIVTTHQNFFQWSSEVKTLLKAHNYHLILDETPNLISIYNGLNNKNKTFDKKTYEYLKKREILTVDTSTKKVKFHEKDKEGDEVKLTAYEDLFNACKQGRLYEYGSPSTCLINKYDPEIFRCFKSVRLLTYLYEGSIAKCYFDLEVFPQKMVDFTHHFAWIGMSSVKKLIDIVELSKEKHLSLDKNSLSATWFKAPSNKSKIEKLKVLTENFFKNKSKVVSKNRLWTTFLDKKDTLKGIGYTHKDNFLEFNARATNDYRDRSGIAYLVNVFMNPLLKNYLLSHSVSVDEEMYSTGEMVQWLYRSCIRDDKPIKVFVPSPRMKKLLKDWIEKTEKFSEFSKKLEEERWKDFDGTCNLPGLKL